MSSWAFRFWFTSQIHAKYNRKLKIWTPLLQYENLFFFPMKNLYNYKSLQLFHSLHVYFSQAFVYYMYIFSHFSRVCFLNKFKQYQIFSMEIDSSTWWIWSEIVQKLISLGFFMTWEFWQICCKPVWFSQAEYSDFPFNLVLTQNNVIVMSDHVEKCC